MRSPTTSLDSTTPAPRSARALVALSAFLLIGGLAVACGPADPVEELESTRARYSAEVASFSVDQTPARQAFTPPAAGEAEGETEDAAAGETPPAEAGAEAGEDGAAPAVEEVPLTQDVILDLLVRFQGREPLEGITLDITHADADEQVKGTYRAWIDVSDVPRGPPAQKVHRLEDVPYEAGDGFHAEVRTPIPESERSAYREFEGIGEGD